MKKKSTTKPEGIMVGPMLHVGASERTLEATTAALVAILTTSASDKAKELAICALSEVCRVQNVSISNNVFQIS
jgi:hypothetical protein